MNAKNDIEVLERYIGTKIPESLVKNFVIHDLLYLYKGLKDYNEINKLCQYISKNPVGGKSISSVLSEMLFNDKMHQWLISDSINDCISLKKRLLSLKVTSIKRWEQEHLKRTALVRAKGTPNIKTKDVYKNALNEFEYESELIDNKQRLIKESVDMGHCVSTYAYKINNGDCAIFSINYDKIRYTLEVGIANNLFLLSQLRGRFNKSAPVELVTSLIDYFDKKKPIIV